MNRIVGNVTIPAFARQVAHYHRETTSSPNVKVRYVGFMTTRSGGSQRWKTCLLLRDTKFATRERSPGDEGDISGEYKKSKSAWLPGMTHAVTPKIKGLVQSKIFRVFEIAWNPTGYGIAMRKRRRTKLRENEDHEGDVRPRAQL